MVVGDQCCNGRMAWMVVVMHRFFHVNGDSDGEPGMVYYFVMLVAVLVWDEADDVPGGGHYSMTSDDDKRENGVCAGRHRGAGTILQRRRHQLKLPSCYAVMQRRHATPTQESGNNFSILFPSPELASPAFNLPPLRYCV